MSPTSSAKPIDANLISLVEQIEQHQNLSVLAARQFRYKLLQTPVDVSITEPRKFNVLEEFILRAATEFNPVPTVKELAEVLGLDLVFVKSTVENLKSLIHLDVSSAGAITIADEGRKLYQQGGVPLPPQIKQVYAIADPFAEITFRFDSLAMEATDLPDLTELVPINSITPDVNCLTLSEIQQLIQASALGLPIPENGKNVNSFSIAGESHPYWKPISIFVLFDVLEDKYTIQVRRGKQILEQASTWLAELESQQKVSLNDLFESQLNLAAQKSKTPTKPKRTRKKT